MHNVHLLCQARCGIFILKQVEEILNSDLPKVQGKIRANIVKDHFLNGYSYEELAKKYNQKEGTIKSRIFRGRQYLQERLTV